MLKWIVTTLVALLFATNAIAQSSSYEIRPGDRLSIEVLEDPALNRSILVLPDGKISFPLAGTIKASGLTVAQLEGALTAGLAPNFAAAPSVFVAVQSVAKQAASTSSGSRTIEVFLIGEAAKPGSHRVARGTNILQFLAQSGGFTKYAAKKRLQLRRTSDSGESKVYRINYKAIEEGRDVSAGMAQLRNGDVIVIPERKLFE